MAQLGIDRRNEQHLALIGIQELVVLIETRRCSSSGRNTVSGCNGNTVSDGCNGKACYETRRQSTTPQVHLDLPPNGFKLPADDCTMCTAQGASREQV